MTHNTASKQEWISALDKLSNINNSVEDKIYETFKQYSAILCRRFEETAVVLYVLKKRGVSLRGSFNFDVTTFKDWSMGKTPMYQIYLIRSHQSGREDVLWAKDARMLSQVYHLDEVDYKSLGISAIEEHKIIKLINEDNRLEDLGHAVCT
jgi:hypothetical protein